MGHEDELTREELQEILKEHQEAQRNVSPEQEEEERGPMPTSATKDLLKKWEAFRAMVLEWHPNQADVSRIEDLYNDNAINYFWKILKRRKAIDIGHVLQRPIARNEKDGLTCKTIYWYWTRTRDKASHGPIPIPLGYRSHENSLGTDYVR
ncbi:uncharacterized protein TNCV_3289581 [Trichonephila clavipes]|nr:uncharacterized protein TNCV_3289581 [Trichonephila clavipes]